MTDLQKYNIPVPRYTSYPTVPAWDQSTFSIKAFEDSLKTTFWECSKEISLYIHLPFCESLCTYCACNTRITKNHSVEEKYIEYLLKEWEIYLSRLPAKPIIKEIHLGGGTPTFFSSKNISKLLSSILNSASISGKVQMSFEGHPSSTTNEHLVRLHKLGFNRLSLGIQDFATNVQQLINRHQTYQEVEKVMNTARAIGYDSINFDVVYGLPGQSTKSLMSTLHKVVTLSPDRIAYYSYAHVPNLKPAQRVYEQYLPSATGKYKFKMLGNDYLKEHGYEEIGMDHFVKPADELMKAREEGNLHRSFMGYTTFSSKMLIGLGVSSISDVWVGFAQNVKKVEDYYNRLDKDELPIFQGHIHSRQDLFFRKKILDLMCHFETEWSVLEFDMYSDLFDFDLFDQMQDDELLNYNEKGVKMTTKGREFVRIACRAIDAKANQVQITEKQFSQSI